MNKSIEILTNKGIKTITQDKLFIVAEVGNQFGGDFDKAIKLCKSASDAGADAVKFIFWFPDEIMAEDRLYEHDGKSESMFEMLNKLRLTFHQWWEIKEYCDSLGIIFMATVNSPSGIDWTENLCLPIIKLSTWDWNYLDLWSWAAKTGFPVIADMGAVTEAEFDRNYNLFIREKNPNFIPMHDFHTKNTSEMNMRTVQYVKETYGCLVGYSAADSSSYLDCAAVALGVSVLEKRLTINRQDGFLHDAVSMEVPEFKNYVNEMRRLKESLGEYMIRPSENDLVERKKWFRRIVADEEIPKGTIILRPMLEAKRGETGVSPERIWDYVGKVAKRDYKRNETITEL